MSKDLSQKPSWISRVLAQLNMSSDGQVVLFHKLATDSFKKTIKLLNKRAEKLEEDRKDYMERESEVLAELKEELQFVAITVDKDALASRDARESYFQTYVRNVKAARNAVKRQETRIKEYNEEVDRAIKVINDEIAENTELAGFLA